ncbi:MAG TPA: 4-hydroxythreonine-4-phosphate dehydrogenase PdxA [Polyangia bacterium]|jgi:4-hydroxythreonine-4-phosphate dehydrogenase|nr:4-hydroxythreonine-4-phosphate dehydrogenase PdxA [Polyangia bacterium]
MNDSRRIGVTMGDPAGIGPELVRAVCAGQTDVVIFGDGKLLAGLDADVIPVTVLDGVVPGTPTLATGAAQLAYLDAAVAAARAGRLDALVTAPIHKASCIAAGFAFPGHTEFLQDRLGAPAVTMMFAGPRMRVSLATIHHALSAVPRVLDLAGVTTAIVQTATALVGDFAVAAPRVAVAGLNPHAGEAGHFGDEESRIIAPAIAAARVDLSAAGLAVDVSGPHVPDVVFRAHLDGHFDAVVAMYHDQGLIPVKLIDFDEAVNVTLGLPIVRTSPDHGVAYDIAGKNLARPTSFAAALRLARQLVAGRRKR